MNATRLAAAAAVLTATAGLGIIGFPTSAGAGNGGALNMVNAYHDDESRGIQKAWAASDDHGFQGMWCAVGVTNGGGTPVTPGECSEGFPKP